MQKLYCYVDETGQDTHGVHFSVCCTIAIGEEKRDALEQLMLRIEKESGKKTKWQKTDNKRKERFLEHICAHKDELFGHIFVEHFYRIESFTDATTEAISRSIIFSGHKDTPSIIYIDGLQRELRKTVSSLLRRYGIRTEKVKGLKDEQNSLIRLSDAIAGFVRDYLEGQDYAKEYFLTLLKEGVITEI